MRQNTATQQDQFREDLSFFNTFLMAFAFVALFVGTFIIYNTFSILVAQRSKDMAMLRAIGAGRRQLLRSMLFESVAIGVIAVGDRPGRRGRHVVRAEGPAGSPSDSRSPRVRPSSPPARSSPRSWSASRSRSSSALAPADPGQPGEAHRRAA